MKIDRKKLKISWVYNETPATATWEPPLDDNFPDIVLRGAARLNPKLRDYYGQLPRTMHHYGGWYSMTDVFDVQHITHFLTHLIFVPANY
ncbi:hypothetical protein N9J58_00035 [bacterium]|nr:hypothetical protein [bacterium]